MDWYFWLLFHYKTYYESYARKYHTNKPEAHNDSFFWPTNCFKVMMERSNTEHFFPIPKFFGNQLDYDWAYLEDIDTRYYEENRESVRHHRHNS